MQHMHRYYMQDETTHSDLCMYMYVIYVMYQNKVIPQLHTYHNWEAVLTITYTQHMDVSENSGTPQIIHFNRVFHYKPSILGYPNFWKHPYIFIYYVCFSPSPPLSSKQLPSTTNLPATRTRDRLLHQHILLFRWDFLAKERLGNHWSQCDIKMI